MLTRVVIPAWILAGVLLAMPRLAAAQSAVASEERSSNSSTDADGRVPGTHPMPLVVEKVAQPAVRDALVRGDRDDGRWTEVENVILKDLIVSGSECVGFDCVSGESFGFDTIRMKENNTQIRFFDTSSSSSFPTRDWAIRANDRADGGKNALFIDDLGDDGTALTTLFAIEAGAPPNALYVRNNGNVGFGTSLPTVDLHAMSGNNPGLRLEQDLSSGFSPQTWDMVGNEVNFFVRDVTNGSNLPLRIRPGSPTSSVDIHPSGVAIGGAPDDPSAQLHVRGPAPTVKVTHSGSGDTFSLDASGNLTLAGLLLESSSREVKENLIPVNPDDVLTRLSQLDLYEWSYKTDARSATHIGPMAEDFRATFGVGADPKHVAALDVSGVALGAVQALERKNREKDEKIAELEAQISSQGAELEVDRKRIEQLSRKLAELVERIEGK